MSDRERLEEASTLALPPAEQIWLGEVELPLRAVFHPLGFSVEIETNSQEVLTAAEESWGRFSKSFCEPPIQLRIGVAEGGTTACPPVPIVRAQRKLLAAVADPHNFIFSDLGQGFAFGWLTQAAVQNRAYLRYHFLEAATTSLLDSLYITPVHGASVELGGKGVLLCGDSGAGKSSLAFACARRGWTYISDDSSSVVRKRNDRTVVGNPHQIRFRPSAVDLFPELRGLNPALRPTGTLSIEVATVELPEITIATECSIDYIVFLNRRDAGPAALVPFPKRSAQRWFEETLSLGDDEIHQAQAASLRTLLTAEVLELRYRDLSWAVNRLEMLVGEHK